MVPLQSFLPLQDVRWFPHCCCWGLGLPGCYAVSLDWGFLTFRWNTLPSSGIKMKAPCSIETSGSPNPATHRCIHEDLSPEVYTSRTTLKMEATSFLERLVFIYHSTQGCIPEDLNLQCSTLFGLKIRITVTAVAMSVQYTGLLQVTALFQILCAWLHLK